MPFGESLMELSNREYDNPYKYNGKELDSQTGLYYYGARYYDPQRSFWLSVDPLVEITMSPYAYTWNDPVNYTDPTGMIGERIGDPGGPTPDKIYGPKEGKLIEEVVMVGRRSNWLSRFRTRTANWAQDNIREPLATSIDENIRNPILKNVREPLSGWFDSHTRNTFVLDAEGQARMDDLRGQMSGYMNDNVGGAIRWGAEHGLVGSGLGTGNVGAFRKASKALDFTIAEAKFNYFFGKVTTGDLHNIQRSAQNLKDLGTLGIKTENQLMKVFGRALAEGTELRNQSNKYGTTITKSIEIGKKGRINVAFFYEGGDMATKPRVTTLIPQIYK